MKTKKISVSLSICVSILLCAVALFAQKVPPPKDVIGFTPGDDKKLASWSQVLSYFQKLADTSPRVRFESIGKTTMDRPFAYATISSPENLKNLEKYKQINNKLADPRLIKSNPAMAQSLIKQGKTVVLITCSIHSTEVGGTLTSMLMAYRLASSDEPEIKKILDETIILLVPSLNPDGTDIVKNWYDKTLGTPFEGTSPPELYHKYTGHDNNRDWYAFTQVETQMTVDKILNVWHPQIVHDIHQQGAAGSRIFMPPYMEPVEPNVPKEMVEGYTELGNFMAKEMRSKGYQGITTDSTYDAWTPARAYSHYHGGVRILSETASVRIATPVTVRFEDLRNGLGYDVKKEAPNFSPVWKGGEWHLRDITDYMSAGAFALMKHAAENREAWLTRFYAVGKEAVRPKTGSELFAYVLPMPAMNGKEPSEEYFRRQRLINILKRGAVEMKTVNAFSVDGTQYAKGTVVIPMAQPYGSFAKALLDKQVYPHLLDDKGNPIPPYDVTAQTLSLLMDVKAVPVSKSFAYKAIPDENFGRGCNAGGQANPGLLIYKSSFASMDEGWTRWMFEIGEKQGLSCSLITASLLDKDIRAKNFKSNVILFPDQSANQMLNGYPKNSMPEEYTGGIGKEGVANLRKFAEDGGKLIFLNDASKFAIREFNLPVRDVTEGLARRDFYIPGSILRTELDTTHPLAKGMSRESIAWFEESPAFEIKTDPAALTNNFKIIARYPQNPQNILLSGWALGAEKLAGKAALVEFTVGKGKIYLFGFRPQYRGQSLATLPLLFNAINAQ